MKTVLSKCIEVLFFPKVECLFRLQQRGKGAGTDEHVKTLLEKNTS